MPVPPEQQAVNELAQLLAVNVDAQPVLVESNVPGVPDCWCVRATLMSANGMLFQLTMNPQNARALANKIKECAGECSVKIIPARRQVIA